MGVKKGRAVDRNQNSVNKNAHKIERHRKTDTRHLNTIKLRNTIWSNFPVDRSQLRKLVAKLDPHYWWNSFVRPKVLSPFLFTNLIGLVPRPRCGWVNSLETLSIYFPGFIGWIEPGPNSICCHLWKWLCYLLKFHLKLYGFLSGHLIKLRSPSCRPQITKCQYNFDGAFLLLRPWSFCGQSNDV